MPLVLSSETGVEAGHLIMPNENGRGNQGYSGNNSQGKGKGSK